MDPILAAVSVLNPEASTDAIGQLSDVAKRFKPLRPPEQMDPVDREVRLIPAATAEPWEIDLDMCGVDESYQRPLDRDKVAAMVKDKAYEQPITVNFDPPEAGGASYWIVDGQHRAEAARQAGHKTIKAHVLMVPSQEEQDHETGVMAKDWRETVVSIRHGDDTFEGHVLPSHEPTLVDVLTGMGAGQELSKVESYGWRGRCYVLRCSAGTVTYVPHDAVEKDAGTILTLPERGLLRFDGLSEQEVERVLKTIALDVAPVAFSAPPPDAPLAAEVLKIAGDVEVLADGVGGRTWPGAWVQVADEQVTVHNGEQMLAVYPYLSRHPTEDGNWHLIGPRQDLTLRAATQ